MDPRDINNTLEKIRAISDVEALKAAQWRDLCSKTVREREIEEKAQRKAEEEKNR